MNHSCQVCFKSFDCLHEFVEHYYQLHDKMHYMCRDCGKQISELKKYINHRVCMHNDQYCEICRYCFNRGQVHCCNQIAQIFACPENSCRGKTLENIKELIKHIKLVHVIDDKEEILQMTKTSLGLEEQINYKDEYQESSQLVIIQDQVDSFKDFCSYMEQLENINQNEPNENKQQQKKRLEKKLIDQTYYQNNNQTDEIKDYLLINNENNFINEWKEQEVELLICQYKDNKWFIRSMRYEDLIVKSFKIIQQINNYEPIFQLIRYGRPNKSPEYYNLNEFKEGFEIVLIDDLNSSPEFDLLIERLWNVRNYSKINRLIFEHKKHSNYMLNKRLKLKCEYCSEKPFKFFEKYIQHYWQCLKQRIGSNCVFKCFICFHGFISYDAWEQHLKIEHFII